MTPDRDDIIVFREFHSSIDAGIAKSKLDAFDIPCFLTEENMASLYQQGLPICIRLHIFKKDIDEVSRILMTATGRNTEGPFCPNCQSTEIERDFPKKFFEEPLGALKVLFFGIFMPEKKINHCLHCDNEF